MHRFFVPPENIDGETVRFTSSQGGQIARVLRLRPNDQVEALDNLGTRYLVSLERIGPKETRGRVLEKGGATGEPATRICLWQGLMKGDRWEWALQKGTEVGVAAFVPVLCARSVVRGTSEGRERRWAAIVQEAAEQSGRGRIPELREPVSWEDACAETAGRALLLYEQERQHHLREALAGLTGRDVNLLAGPEGGIADEEAAFARELGIPAITLGERVLRAETAGPVAAALVLYERGEI